MFDAQIPHGITRVLGRRLSIAFFVPVRHDQIDKALESDLRRHGFPLDLPLALETEAVLSLPLFVAD
eukprot:5649628-Amphidinium_carterae.1